MYLVAKMIAPEMAQKLLENNNLDKRYNHKRMLEYADAMSRGEWKHNPGDNIVVFSNGKLGNGHHRLLAVIHSGTSQMFNFCYGADPETFKVLDQQWTRTSGQLFAMEGEKNANAVAAVARLQAQWEQSGTIARTSRSGRITYRVLEDTLALNPCLRDAARFADTMKRNLVGRGALTAWLKFQCDLIDIEKSNEFWSALQTGANLSEGSPVLALSTALQNIVTYRRKTSDTERAALVLKSFFAYRDGKQIKVLRWNPIEGFPLAAPEGTSLVATEGSNE